MPKIMEIHLNLLKLCLEFRELFQTGVPEKSTQSYHSCYVITVSIINLLGYV